MAGLILPLFLLAFMSVRAQEKSFPVPGINFSPEKYICYKISAPLKIDGRLEEPDWNNSEWTNHFVDIEGDLKPAPRYKTRAKMLWDDNYLYIGAELEEPDLWAALHQRDTIIFYDNDFEIFIDPDGDTHKYFEIEMNALNTVWDLLLVKPYRDGENVAVNSWDIRGLKTAVHLNGTLNDPGDTDKGWSCEIAIPWSALKESWSNESAPKPGEQWRINFSRVEWKRKIVNGHYEKEKDPATGKPYPEDNWVWSPQGIVAMHYPEMWGFIQFSSLTAGSGKENFVVFPEDAAKWFLRKLYYAEKSFFINNGRYTANVADLNLEQMKFEGYIFPPVIQATDDLFEAKLFSIDGKEFVTIKNDGEVTVHK